MTSNILAFMAQRVAEPSTWRGVVALLASVGIAVDPGHLETFVTSGLALIGLIGALTPDKR